MGNCTSNKRGSMSSSSFFESQRTEQENKKGGKQPTKKKNGKNAEARKSQEAIPAKVGSQPPMLSYDDESIKRMRNQIRNDPTAFLLNNIMLGVQFFENYDRIVEELKNNSIIQSDVVLNPQMAQHQKQVILPDKLTEYVNEYVQFVNRYEELEHTTEGTKRKAIVIGQSKSKIPEPLYLQRMFVVHDNIEVTEPEMSEYSTVSGGPFYKMLMERSDEPGYIKLRKLEAIENTVARNDRDQDLSDAIEAERFSETESDSALSDTNDTDASEYHSGGLDLLNSIKQKVDQQIKPTHKIPENLQKKNIFQINEVVENTTERRPSGILKQPNNAIKKGRLNHMENKPHKKIIPELIYNPQGSDSSGYTSRAESIASESDYGYTTITAETTPRRLEISSNARISDSTSIIPPKCISTVKIKRMNLSSDEDENDNLYDRRKDDFPQDLYKELHYLNSNKFMSHFADLFLLKLSHILGFTPDAVKKALTQGASIYCNVHKKEGMKAYEVIPALNSSWPHEATKWLWRKRNIICNPRTNFTYQWPPKNMIEKCQGLGCLIVPLGFIAPRNNNPQKELQWKLSFPAVERQLETTMAHSQVRCFVFSISLFRSFMEIESSHIGLECSHIKNHLYWQLEENYARYPEDRLGEALMIFLNSLYDHLKKGELPDFFIPQCNQLKRIPKSVLLKQQRRLADIRESPVMHLIVALRNLKYTKKVYYPVLDYKKLYNILTTTDILRLANPGLPMVMNEEDDEEKNEFNQKSFWEERREENPQYAWKKQQLKQINARREQKLREKVIPKSQIDRKKKIGEFDMNRRRLVLQLFIPHFISMAEWSEKFSAYRQALIYLEHANRLVTLLKDEPGGVMQSDEFKKKIQHEIKSVTSKAMKNIPPRVPKRNESFNLPGGSGTNKIKTEQYTSYPNGNDAENQITYRQAPPPDSPTIKININIDVHSEMDRPKSHRVVSLQDLAEEECDESNDFEESKL